MDRSKFLSKVIGIYLFVVSVMMLMNMQQFMMNLQGLISNPALVLTIGFFTLVLGTLLIVSHNRWSWHWTVIITLIGWIIFLKSICILFYPIYMDRVTIAFLQSARMAYVSAFIDLMLGLFLCYEGFKRD